MSDAQNAASGRKLLASRAACRGPLPGGRLKKMQRRDTVRYRVLKLLAEGTHTMDEIASLSGAGTAANAVSHVACLRRDFGVGHARDPATGHWHALFAPGRAEELLCPPDLRPQPRGRGPITITNTAW
jgi:hypothetical protein